MIWRYWNIWDIWRIGIIQKPLWNLSIFCFLCRTFWAQNVLIHPDQNLSIPLDQMHRFFVSNICNGNISALWDRKSCTKSWYSSKSLRILSVFLVWFFGPKMFRYNQIIYYSSLPANLRRKYFQATVASVLVFWTKSWTLTKSLEKAIGGAYFRMLRAVMNISWKQHPTKEAVLWQHSTSQSSN